MAAIRSDTYMTFLQFLFLYLCISCRFFVSQSSGGTVRIAIMVPINTSDSYGQAHVEPGIQIAIEKINRDKTYLFDSIETEYINSHCPNNYEYTRLVLKAIELMKQNTSCLFGPTFDYGLAQVARILSYEKFPVISPGGLDLNFGVNKTLDRSYQTLVRTGGTTNTLSQCLRSLLAQFSFGRIKVLSQKHETELEICQHFYNSLDYFVNLYGDLEFDLFLFPKKTNFRDLLLTEVGNRFAGKCLFIIFVGCI